MSIPHLIYFISRNLLEGVKERRNWEREKKIDLHFLVFSQSILLRISKQYFS